MRNSCAFALVVRDISTAAFPRALFGYQFGSLSLLFFLHTHVPETQSLHLLSLTSRLQPSHVLQAGVKLFRASYSPQLGFASRPPSTTTIFTSQPATSAIAIARDDNSQYHRPYHSTRCLPFENGDPLDVILDHRSSK